MSKKHKKSLNIFFIPILFCVSLFLFQVPFFCIASPGAMGQQTSSVSKSISIREINKSAVPQQAVLPNLNKQPSHFKTLLQTQITSPKSYYICRSRGEVRTLRLVKKNDGICYINYTKQGIDEKVGESKSHSTCNTVIDNIRSNLEGAAWKCKNISSSQITEPKSLQ